MGEINDEIRRSRSRLEGFKEGGLRPNSSACAREVVGCEAIGRP